MISYYITWHTQARLAPILFTDDDKPAAQAARHSPVAPAARSPRALAKAAAKRTDGNLPVHSFDSLPADLATICLNQIQPATMRREWLSPPGQADLGDLDGKTHAEARLRAFGAFPQPASLGRPHLPGGRRPGADLCPWAGGPRGGRCRDGE